MPTRPRPAVAPALPRRLHLPRVSTSEQDAELQRRAFRELAARFPCIDVGTIESGVNGLQGDLAYEDRPDLQEVERRAKAKEFDQLAILDVTRATRHLSMFERARVGHLVGEHGAVFIEANGHIIDTATPVGEMEWMMRTRASAEEKKLIAFRTTGGKKTAALEGRYLGSPPYARRYDYDAPPDKRWSVDQDELKVYLRIVDAPLRGISLRALARQFESESIPVPHARYKSAGRAWHSTTIGQLLRSRSVIGEVSCMGIRMKCPPITSQATWKRAIAAVGTNNRDGRPMLAPERALIRGVAVCGVCGAAMHIATTKASPKGRLVYYVCSTHREKWRMEECGRFYNAERIDPAAREAMLRILAAEVAPEPKHGPDPQAAIKEAKHTLAALKIREERAVLSAENLGLTPFIKARQQAIAAERAAANAILAAATAALREPPQKAIDHKRRKDALLLVRSANLVGLRAFVERVFRRGDVRIRPGGTVEIRSLDLTRAGPTTPGDPEAPPTN